MATPVIMPRQGQSVESCIIVKWHKKVGDSVKPGDLLFSYETDKAAFDEEAKVEGTLLEIFFSEDEDVPVLTNVCVIGTPGESAVEFNPRSTGAEFNPKSNAAPVPAETFSTPEVRETPTQAVTAAPIQSSPDEPFKISPRAKNLADRIGIDSRYANPSGPGGRIIERDIIALQESGPKYTPAAAESARALNIDGMESGTGIGGRITTSDLQKPVLTEPPVTGNIPTDNEQGYLEVKLSNIRKVIAKAMHQSLSSTAQLTLNTSFDATEILEYRKKVKANMERTGSANITLNDIILYAVSRTLPNHPELNAHFLDDKMLLFNRVHLGIATDTERGLMVPTLFNADRKSLAAISREAKELVQECKKGMVNPDALKGGTFTITNLGALGIESFTPVLNPPQTGILGVNNIVYRVKEVNGAYQNYSAMGLSLTFDHRALDGAPAARFLQELAFNLENFTILLSK